MHQCHCGYEFKPYDSDHCPVCGCEEHNGQCDVEAKFIAVTYGDFEGEIGVGDTERRFREVATMFERAAQSIEFYQNPSKWNGKPFGIQSVEKTEDRISVVMFR